MSKLMRKKVEIEFRNVQFGYQSILTPFCSFHRDPILFFRLSEIVEKSIFNADSRKSNADSRRFSDEPICDHLRYICEYLRSYLKMLF